MIPTTTSTEECQRIVVIDDHPLFRKGVHQLIAIEPGFTIVGEAGSGAAGLELVRTLQPDLVLLDLNMAGMDGIATLKAIKELDLPTRVIMLTVSNNDEDLVAALRAGADGYLLKDMEPEDLLTSLRESSSGKLTLTPALMEMLAHALRKDTQPTPLDRAELTDREREILALIAQGLSNKMIARELDITEGTVKVHVKHLLKKLNLRSRVEAAVWAVTGKGR